MPNWKKVAISGSNISQFNNDGIYTKMSGSTANGLLTYESSETASVESKITYDGSIQRLVNNGQTNIYSGSYTSGQEPAINVTSALKLTSLLSPAGALYTPTGSKNSVLSVVGRHSDFGSGGECSATIAITSQIGNSSKNATVQLSAIGKEDGCHDSIFTIGLKKDIGGTACHPVNEFLRMDGRTFSTTLSSSLSIQPSKISSTASLEKVLVLDGNTGEIKTSSCTPITADQAPSLSVAGKDSSGNVVSELDTTAITFLCAPTTTPGSNSVTLKIHSATESSNQAQIPFPDTNNQLVGCENIYVCTAGTNGSLWNNGGGLVIINNNLGSVAEPASANGAIVGKNWIGPVGNSDAANYAAPIYNIRSTTIGGYSRQNATASLSVSAAQNTLNTTDNNNFTRIRMTHVDCNNQTYASTDFETISLGTNGSPSYLETTGLSINLRGRDQLYYRRLYIESDNTTAKDANIMFSGSLHVDTSQMNTSSSLSNVLVYDDTTGEIKKSTLTPINRRRSSWKFRKCSI